MLQDELRSSLLLLLLLLLLSERSVGLSLCDGLNETGKFKLEGLYIYPSTTCIL